MTKKASLIRRENKVFAGFQTAFQASRRGCLSFSAKASVRGGSTSTVSLRSLPRTTPKRTAFTAQGDDCDRLGRRYRHLGPRAARHHHAGNPASWGGLHPL